MAKPYSPDLRERVIAAVTEGRSRHSVAKLFKVSPSAVIKWMQRFKATGSAASKPMGGVRRDALGEQRTWARQRLAEKPDLTLEAVREELAARGTHVSVWAVWKFCRAEKLTFKKKPVAQRTTTHPRRALAREVETAATQTRSGTARLHR